MINHLVRVLIRAIRKQKNIKAREKMCLFLQYRIWTMDQYGLTFVQERKRQCS